MFLNVFLFDSVFLDKIYLLNISNNYKIILFSVIRSTNSSFID